MLLLNLEQVEAQISALNTRIAQQQVQVTQLENECNELRHDLADFTERYNKIIKPIATQLEAVEKAIKSLEELRKQQAYGVEETIESLWRTSEQPPRPQPAPAKSAPADDPLTEYEQMPSANRPTGERIRALYRKLARMFHPDLAKDDADRQHRTALMSLINRAYADHDYDTLAELDQPLPPTSPLKTSDDSVFRLRLIRLRYLQKQSFDLADRMDALTAERVDLSYGAMMQMAIQDRLVQAQGQDYLKQLATHLEAEYWKQITRLDELRASVK